MEQKSGKGNYGIGVIMQDTSPATVSKMQQILAVFVITIIEGIVNQKKIEAGDRLDMKLYVTKAGSN